MSVNQGIQGPGSSGEESRLVLIVDDEPSMRTALSETVRRMGFQVKGAIDGADALEQVQGNGAGSLVGVGHDITEVDDDPLA